MQLDKLVVSLEARVTQFEKAMAKAAKVSDQQMGRIQKNAESLDRRLASFGRNSFDGLARGALAAAVPLFSVTAAIAGAKAALAEFGDIADNAKSAGLDAEFFQGIAHGAQLAGVDMNALSGALNTFNKNSGLAVENKGRMVSALKALNPELLANVQAAKSQEERLRLAADAIRETTNEAQRAALATALFGDAGFKLADAFSGGSAGIDQTIAAARNLGIIVDRDLVNRAEQLGDEFDTAAKIVDLQLKQAFINLAPFMVTAAQWAGEFARLLGIAADQLKAVEDRQHVRPLQNELAGVYNERAAAARRVAEIEAAIGGGAPNAQILQLDLSEARAQFDDLTQRADTLLTRITELQGNTSTSITPPSLADVPGAGDDLPGVGGSSRNAAADAAVRQAEAVRNLIADLQHEQAQLGRTAEQQELYNALKSVGVTLESSYGEQISGAMSALQAQRAQIEANAEAMALFDSVSQQALNTVINGFLEGKDAGEIFGDMLGDIAQQLLSMGISGLTGGLGTALFPGIPMKEHGGPVRRGQPYIVGEKRPELFVPDQNGVIIPQVPDARGMGSSMSFPYAPVVTVMDGSSESLSRVERVLAKQQAEFEVRVKQIVRSRGSKWK